MPGQKQAHDATGTGCEAGGIEEGWGQIFLEGMRLIQGSLNEEKVYRRERFKKQIFQVRRGHFDKCPLYFVFHSMHSLLLRRAFLQLYNTIRRAHYWMSNALNKFYYFMLDVWGYPLISDSYYPETK